MTNSKNTGSEMSTSSCRSRERLSLVRDRYIGSTSTRQMITSTECLSFTHQTLKKTMISAKVMKKRKEGICRKINLWKGKAAKVKRKRR